LSEYLDAARIAHGIGVSGSDMATADKSNDGHTSRQRRNDAAQAVLDHQTPLWSNIVLRGSVEK
jgi:hypothetical protein